MVWKVLPRALENVGLRGLRWLLKERLLLLVVLWWWGLLRGNGVDLSELSGLVEVGIVGRGGRGRKDDWAIWKGVECSGGGEVGDLLETPVKETREVSKEVSR